MRRETFNVLQLGFALMLIMAAFFTQGLIEETVISTVSFERNVANRTGEAISEHAGYYSLAIIYAVFTPSNFVAPPIIGLIGAKWAMVIGASFYCLFMAAFLKLTTGFLYFTSGLVGLGAALMWTGHGNYLTSNSSRDTIGRNSGMLYAMIQSCLIYGGVFLYFIFRSMKQFDEPSIRILYTWFLIVCVCGVVCLAFLRSPPATDCLKLSVEKEEELLNNLATIDNKVNEKAPGLHEPKVTRKWTTVIENFVRTFKLLKTRNMLLLCVIFLYTGVKLTFWTGIYSTCLSFTTRLNQDGDHNSLLALNALSLGSGQMIGSSIFGLFGKKTAVYGRNSIVILGMVIHLVCYSLIFINIPMEAPLHRTDKIAWIEPNYSLALVSAFLLGFGDSCYVTQVYSILGSMYSDDSSSAFALYNTFQSVAACTSFLYGSVLQLHWQLLILALGTVLSAVCYYPVERHAQMKQREEKSSSF